MNVDSNSRSKRQCRHSKKCPQEATSSQKSKSIFYDLHTHESKKLKRKFRRLKRKCRNAFQPFAAPLCVLICITCVTLGGLYSSVKIGEAAMLPGSSNTQSDNSNLDTQTIVYQDETYAPNESMVGICLLGFSSFESDEESSEAIKVALIVAIDTCTGEVSFISIPCTGILMDSQHASDEETCSAFTKALSQTFYDITLSYYFAFDLSGFSELSNSTGGVAVEALETIPNTNITKGKYISLSGSQAICYVSWYDTNAAAGHYNLQCRQIQYLEAFAEQNITNVQGNMDTIIEIYSTVVNYSLTNLTATEMSFLASTLITQEVNDIEVYAINSSTESESGLDETALYETFLDVYYTEL